jgi:RNA polymerase sigma factor for flagellar operon FliA
MDELAESGDGQLPESPSEDPFAALSDEEYQRQLADAIRGLPQRERLVMSLYYDEELNFREIGEVLEVSESRICQIHGQAMLRIRGKMSQWREDA